MNILYINQTPIHGGAEEILFEIMLGAIRSGHKAILLVPYSGWLSDKCRDTGITVYFLPTLPDHTCSGPAGQSKHLIKNNFRIARLARRVQAEIIHINTPRLAYHSGLAALLTRTPMVVHVHDIVDSPYRSLLKRFYLNAVSSMTITVSEAVKNVVSNSLNSGRVQRVYNGVDLASYETISGHGIRESYGIKNDDILIGTISAMTPWKGQDMVIRAFTSIASREPRLKLLVAGGARNHQEEQKHEANLRQLSKDSGFSDRIIFAGWTERALQTMMALDVFVHVPVRPDPFPTVIIHAMCLKKAIIASRIGGIPEMTADADGAILVEPGNVPALSDAMLALYRDTSLRNSLGAKAYTLSRRFDRNRMVDEIKAIYALIGSK